MYDNPFTRDWVLSTPLHCEAFNEKPLYSRLLGQGIRGKLDRIVVDHPNKRIIHIDLKTSETHPSQFEPLIRSRKIYRQMAMYDQLLLREMYANYDIIHYVVAIHTKELHEVGVYKIDRSWIDLGYSELTVLLSAVSMCEVNESWSTLPVVTVKPTQDDLESWNRGIDRIRMFA
jgi:hypothetical protein